MASQCKVYLQNLDTDEKLKAAMTFRQIHPMLLYIAQCGKYTRNTQVLLDILGSKYDHMGQTPEQDKKCDPSGCSRLETSKGGQKTKETEGRRDSVPGRSPLCSSVQSSTADPLFQLSKKLSRYAWSNGLAAEFAKPLLLNSTSNQNPAGVWSQGRKIQLFV